MKMYVFSSVLVSLILVAATRRVAAQTEQVGASNVVAQGASITSTQAEVNPPPEPHPGISDADFESNQQWRKTPEFKAMVSEITGISHIAEPRGYLTTNEVERIIFYMQSPHHIARIVASIAAGMGRSDPAKSMLIPQLISLLSDPVGPVRQTAAHTLGIIGDKDMIPHLEPLLKDPFLPVVRNAQKAIAKLKEKEAAPGK